MAGPLGLVRAHWGAHWGTGRLSCLGYAPPPARFQSVEETLDGVATTVPGMGLVRIKSRVRSPCMRVSSLSVIGRSASACVAPNDTTVPKVASPGTASPLARATARLAAYGTTPCPSLGRLAAPAISETTADVVPNRTNPSSLKTRDKPAAQLLRGGCFQACGMERGG